MTTPTQNSRNPANSGTLTGALKEILGKFLAGTDDMLPAVVIAYDRETNRATVKPQIRLLKTDGKLLDRAEIASVPVINLGGGDVVLSFNILPGDLGWIKANDRDISLFLQSMKNSGPNTIRKHSFSDSLFIPDQFKKWTLNGEDDTAAVFQTLDGMKRIAIDATGIRMTSDTTVKITAPVSEFTGDITATGTITADVDVEADGVSLKSHTHAQGNDSNGDSEVESDPPS